MRLHRFIGKFDFTKNLLRVSDKDLLNQWKNVLRLKPGDQVILVDDAGNEAVAQLKKLDKDSAELILDGVTSNEKEPEIEVTLYCSVLKMENFELVVQKATEAGVKEIVPIVSKRTVKLNLRRDRLEKIAKEAAEQSGRGIVPRVAEITALEKAFKHCKDYDANLFFQPGAPLFSQERLRNSGARRASIFIGPEGGWDESEIELARQYDLKVVGLSGFTLRSETAAIIATWAVANS